MRFHGRLRRLPRHLPRRASGRRAANSRARIPFWLARHSRAGGAGIGRTDLHVPPARIRAVEHALVEFYKHGSREALERYSEICLRRVWKVQRFSWWMTSMLHRFPNEDSTSHHLHLAELDYVTSSRAASTTLAENYVGLPFEPS